MTPSEQNVTAERAVAGAGVAAATLFGIATGLGRYGTGRAPAVSTARPTP
jgi:hypothetical protein